MRKHLDNSGFTLVEMIFVVAMTVLLMAVIMNSVVNLYQTNSYTIAQSNEIDVARRGLQEWQRDAKEMTYSDDGTFPVAIMNTHEMAFYSDVDGDPAVEYVRFLLSTTTATTTLYKYTHEPTGTPPVYNLVTPSRTETLSEYVQNLVQATSTFLYFDTNGAPLTSTSSLLTDVRYLETRIIVNIDPLRSPGEFMLRGGVSPRNLKDNL